MPARFVFDGRPQPVFTRLLVSDKVRPMAPARVVYEHTTDNLRGGSKEVCAVLPVDALLIHETNVDIVDQRGGLECVPGGFSAHTFSGELSKLVIYKWHKAIESVSIAIVPCQQEFGYAGRLMESHLLLPQIIS